MQQPIGVFDSGLGGLTVLRELATMFPNEDFVYLGDTARLPYGNKSPAIIRKYGEENLIFLKRHKVKAVVIACNSASSQFSETKFEGLPIVTVIAPTAQTAAKISKNGRIGVLGTRATIASEVYNKHLLASGRKDLKIFTQSAPLLVPIAEEGLIDDPLTNLVVYRYLQPLIRETVDTIILACTHYPILRSSLAKAAGSAIELLDCSRPVAEDLATRIEKGDLERGQARTKKIQILSTDGSNLFENMAKQLLAGLDAEFHTVHNQS